MKKLLTALGVLTLGTTTGNLSGFLNTTSQKTNTLNNYNEQIKGPLSTMTTDKDGNVYVGNWSGNDNGQIIEGTVYKCLAGQNKFIRMTGIYDGSINSLDTDKDGNVYALDSRHGIVYKCLAKKTNFVKFAQINVSKFNYETAVRLKTIDDDIYVGTMCQNRFNGTVVTGGKLFKINNIGNVTKVNGWTHDNGSVVSLAVASNGTIYAGTVTDINKGNLYKSKNDGSFELVSGWNETNGEVYSLDTDKDGNVYVGTSAINVKGNLYKVDNIGTLEIVSNWNKNNGQIAALTIDSDDNVYVEAVYPGVKSAIVYKSTDNHEFTSMRGTETERWLWSMTTDKDGNVYVGGFEEIYKCLAGQDTFMPMLNKN